jgi:hypothetical protein
MLCLRAYTLSVLDVATDEMTFEKLILLYNLVLQTYFALRLMSSKFSSGPGFRRY